MCPPAMSCANVRNTPFIARFPASRDSFDGTTCIAHSELIPMTRPQWLRAMPGTNALAVFR